MAYSESSACQISLAGGIQPNLDALPVEISFCQDRPQPQIG